MIPTHPSHPRAPSVIRTPSIPFDPATLFAGGEEGGIWDFSDSSTLWADTGKTTQATTTVAAVDDLSGNGNTLLQATGAQQPVISTFGAYPTIQLDGTDDNMTVALDLSGTTGITMIAALHKLSDAASARLLDLSGTGPILHLKAPSATIDGRYYALSNNGANSIHQLLTDVAAPHTAVFDVRTDIAEPFLSLKVNQQTELTNATSQGSTHANWGAARTLYVGMRSVGAERFNGHLARLVIVGRRLADSELIGARKWANSAIGAY